MCQQRIAPDCGEVAEGERELALAARVIHTLAHEFNNLLTLVSSSVEFAEQRADDPRSRQALRDALEAVALSSALSRRYAGCAPVAKPSHELITLTPQLRQCTALLRQMFDSAISIQAELPDDLWPVRIAPADLDSVLVNLMLNARDAMPEGGILGINAENFTAKEESGNTTSATGDNDWVRLTVRDTGRGMSEAVRARATEAFFTTKPAQRNIGLGLCAVSRIIDCCGGVVRIESSLDAGTSVIIDLPRGDAATS